ncbi:response regulator [Rhizobium miluonense]|uniref:response regulator n=1 Tax=Rhizobium miluonense TaxID=411945 RepID=UPI000B8171E2|nr:response regulator [Rhizobium miluonense]
MQRAPLIGIIDDDRDIPAALGSLVRSIGYRAECFYSGEQILARSDLSLFSCIISDIHMPGLSGIELVQLLHGVVPELPVILMTGRIEQALTQQAAACGAISLIMKPFTTEDIVQKLSLAIASRSRA